MTWQLVRAAIPVLAVGYGVVTQAFLRLLVGTVLAAMGIIALIVAAVDHTSEAIPVVAGGAAAVAAGLALVWWGYERSDIGHGSPAP